MRILVAGSTGAVGKPLIPNLIQFGQDVYGITHSQDRAQTLAAAGAKPLILDVMNRDAVFATIESIRPDVVIDMLTALPKDYTPEAMKAAASANVKIRREGGGNLQAAAETYNVRRYIVQSSGYYYVPGAGLADESVSFAFDATPEIAAGAHVYSELETRVLQSEKIEGVALRFGFFYGPGTWYCKDGSMGQQVLHRQLPVIGHGEGVWNFIHVEDAAKATAAAIYVTPGAYNIVNNRPAMMREWLPGFARYIGAPPPLHMPEDEALKRFGPDFVYYATKLRGASNAKIKKEYNFDPRNFEWLI